MIKHLDSSQFDENHQYQEMKQTAQFFNPQKNQLGQSIKFQQKELQRVPMKSPKQQAIKLNYDGRKNVLNKQVNEKTNSQTIKEEGITKSPQQNLQNLYITPVMHKFGSPPKLMNVPQVKPLSPPLPKCSTEHIIITQNNSVAPNIQSSEKDKFFQNPKTSGNQFNISMSDLQPNQKQLSKKQTGQYVKPEYPSYQKSLLDSKSSKFNSEQMDKSNSTNFLPRMTPQAQKINVNQYIGYGSIGQLKQQESALRTNSSQQTITPFNEFINLPNDDVSRQSKTAQYILRDTQGQQNKQLFAFKINNIKQNDQQINNIKQNNQYHQLPQIQSPQSRGGKPFLERTPQKKIVNRLFSPKSNNNQVT
ncbi:unnamed protein product [Paramecium sonneborni]|uniref:Uncharacterized protein n=1 Tax=Paramecium sonneborni TaxID=65129 RepID=A0A8S1R4M5_9CILI|nr:unnamed protein product [Paramecium sonneborni]